MSVTDEQRRCYERDGFFRIDGFAEETTGEAMLHRVTELARRADAGDDISPAFVLPEQQPDLPARGRRRIPATGGARGGRVEDLPARP